MAQGNRNNSGRRRRNGGEQQAQSPLGDRTHASETRLRGFIAVTVNAKLGVSDVAAVCDVCGKGPGFGNSVSHSHRKTRRRWNPNIQTVHAKIGLSQRKRMNVCTSCIRAGKMVRG